MSNHRDQFQTWKLNIRWSYQRKNISVCERNTSICMRDIFMNLIRPIQVTVTSDSLHFWRIFMNMLFLHTTGAAYSKYWWENTRVIPRKNLHLFWKSSRIFPQTEKSFHIALDNSRIDLLLNGECENSHKHNLIIYYS